MISQKQIEDARAHGFEVLNSPSRVNAARYDLKSQRIVITLVSGVDLTVPPAIVQGLTTATPEQLSEIEISPMGTGIHFPLVDADILVPELLKGYSGTRKWMARELGRYGGSQKTEKKSAASRANGRLGGRPRRTG